MLVFGNPAFSFIAANLLVQSVEKLLARGCARKRGAMVQRAAKAPKIQQTLWRPIEGNAHAIQQIDNRRRGFTHGFHRGLVGKKVAAVDRVVKVLPGCVAFTLEVFGGIDAALGAYGMRSLDRHDRKEIYVTARFSNLDGCRQPCQPAAYHDNFWCRCHKYFNHKGHEESRRNLSALLHLRTS